MGTNPLLQSVFSRISLRPVLTLKIAIGSFSILRTRTQGEESYHPTDRTQQSE